MPTAQILKLEPFTMHFAISVECKEFERLSDETVEEARSALVRELAAGFKQTAYDVNWDIEEQGISEGVEV